MNTLMWTKFHCYYIKIVTLFLEIQIKDDLNENETNLILNVFFDLKNILI